MNGGTFEVGSMGRLVNWMQLFRLNSKRALKLPRQDSCSSLDDGRRVVFFVFVASEASFSHPFACA